MENGKVTKKKMIGVKMKPDDEDLQLAISWHGGVPLARLLQTYFRFGVAMEQHRRKIDDEGRWEND